MLTVQHNTHTTILSSFLFFLSRAPMPSLLTQVMHLYVSILIKAMLETILVDTLVSSGRPTIANDLLQQSHKPPSYTSKQSIFIPWADRQSRSHHMSLKTITWLCFCQLCIKQHPSTHNSYNPALPVISPLALYKTPHRNSPVNSNLPENASARH